MPCDFVVLSICKWRMNDEAKVRLRQTNAFESWSQDLQLTIDIDMSNTWLEVLGSLKRSLFTWRNRHRKARYICLTRRVRVLLGKAWTYAKEIEGFSGSDGVSRAPTMRARNGLGQFWKKKVGSEKSQKEVRARQCRKWASTSPLPLIDLFTWVLTTLSSTTVLDSLDTVELDLLVVSVSVVLVKHEPAHMSLR